MSTKGTRILEYDLLRSLATVLVVSLHVFSVANAQKVGIPSPNVSLPMRMIFWAGTAIFAFLTGALVWTARPQRTPAELVDFAKRRLSVVVLPYLPWALFYIFVFILPSWRILNADDAGLFAWDVLRRTVYGKSFYHLYFVPVVIALYALAPLVSRVVRRHPMLVLLVGIALGAWEGYVPLAASHHLVNVRNLVVVIVRFIPFAAAGAWYGVKKERIDAALDNMWPVILGIGLGMRYLDVLLPLMGNVGWQRVFELAYMLPVILGLIGVARLAARKLPAALTTAMGALAATSYFVYLAHPAVLRGVDNLVKATHHRGVWARYPFDFAVIAGILAFCHFSGVLAMKTKRLGWIVRGPKIRRLPDVAPLPVPSPSPGIASPGIGGLAAAGPPGVDFIVSVGDDPLTHG